MVWFVDNIFVLFGIAVCATLRKTWKHKIESSDVCVCGDRKTDGAWNEMTGKTSEREKLRRRKDIAKIIYRWQSLSSIPSKWMAKSFFLFPFRHHSLHHVCVCLYWKHWKWHHISVQVCMSILYVCCGIEHYVTCSSDVF